MSDIFSRIQEIITTNEVVLFMKGNKDMPQCGFSATVVQILNKIGVYFISFYILQDAQLRQGIKDFSDWPTIPQLYIKGEFIGGCDIVREMFENGELQNLFTNQALIS
jgi:monothiol glutaredoxin